MQFVTRITFKRWLREATPGERFVYYTGEGLGRDRQYHPDLDALATMALSEPSVRCLQQPKPGSRVDLHYIAEKLSDFVQTANPKVSGRARVLSSAAPSPRTLARRIGGLV